MVRRSTENEVLSLEKQYWQAIKDHDVETCLRLTDDPCIVAGPNGVARVDHEQLAEIMGKPTYTLKEFDLEDAQVRFLKDDVAIVAYKVHEDVDVRGEARTIDANDSSMWVRRDGAWVCAMHTEAIAGDPFERKETTSGGNNDRAASRRPDLS